MSERSENGIYAFDQFKLDVDKLMLYRDEVEVPLAPKVVKTLSVLIESRGSILSKEELIDRVWEDSVVEESNLSQHLYLLRKTLGTRGDGGPYIETLRRRGYRFTGDVRQVEAKQRSGKLTTPEIRSVTEAYADQPSQEVGHAAPAIQVASLRPNARVVAIADWRSADDVDAPLPNQADANLPARGDRDAAPATKADLRHAIISASVIFALLVLVGAFFFLNSSSFFVTRNQAIRTIAVLPFKPAASDSREEALEIGMADTLIARLGSNSHIVVRPISSVRRFSSLDSDPQQAGLELGVEAVLDGVLQRSGDKIRVNVRLIKVADGSTLWAETFDEKLTEIFVVQDAISNRVASALGVKLASDEKRRLNRHYTESVEAYQLYLKGRLQVVKLRPAESQKAIQYFQQAIEIDPNYAPAYVGLASAFRSLALAAELPSTEFLPKAKAAAQKAIEIDETLADAHAELGYNVFWFDWDWTAAELHDKRAIELNPNSADAHFAYAHFLSDMGRHPEALAEIRRARELDPLNLKADVAEAQFLIYAGQTDEALGKLKRSFEIDPNYWFARMWAACAYIDKGMYSEATVEATKARELSGVNTLSSAFGGYALAKSGKVAEAELVLNELLDLSKERYVPPYNIALVYNGLGRRGLALEWLEKGLAERDPRMVFLGVEAKWDNLRTEARMIEILTHMNLGRNSRQSPQ